VLTVLQAESKTTRLPAPSTVTPTGAVKVRDDHRLRAVFADTVDAAGAQHLAAGQWKGSKEARAVPAAWT